MMSSWMDNLRSWLQPGSGRAGRTPRGRARLRVEHLEVRDTPSITIGGPAPVLGPPPVWQPVGPVSIADSTSNTLPTGANFSAGATESISVDPFNPNRVAIGTVNGGVWVTNNYTTVNPVWTTHTDALPSLAIGSVAWSPTLPNTLFAGSGSYSAGGLDGTFHAGIGVAFPGTGGAPGFFYRSNDGGNTWSQLGGTTFSGQRIANVVPTTLNGGQTIFVGTSDRPVTSSGGVYRSNDGGNTWTRLSGANGLPNLAVTSVIADPTNPNRFYAAAVGGAGAGVYLLDTTNGNVAWVNVSGNLSTATLAGADRILLSATPAGVKPIYAAILSPDPALPGSGANLLTGIFRAVAYPGPTYVWTAIGPNGLPPDVTPGGQGSIHFAIAADPASDRTVYVAGDRRREPPFDAVIARGDAIQNTWTAITDYPAPATPPTPGTVDPLVSSPAPTTAPHADTRYMAFAGNAILVADDGGVYQVTNPDGVRGVPTWTSLSRTLQTTEQYSTALDDRNNTDPSDDVYLSAAQDNGTSEGLAGTAYQFVDGGDGVLVFADAPGGYRYYSAQNFSLLRRDPNGQLVTPPANVIGTNLSLNGNIALQIPPVSQGQVYLNQLLIGAGPFLFLSFDHADNFKSVGGVTGGNPDPVPPFALNSFVTAIGFGTIQTPHAAYVATDDGNLYRSFDVASGTGNFVVTNFKTVAAGAIAYGIVLDPNNPLIAYAVTNRAVFKTTDGMTWTNITGNLLSLTQPGGLVTLASIALFTNATTDPSDDAVLVGGYGGVFELSTINPAAGWTKFGVGSNLPNVLIDQLIYDPNSDTLVAGTYGRGIWRLPNASNGLNPGFSVLVRGDINPNEMTVYPDLTDPKFYFVSDGLGAVQRFDSTVYRAVQFRGLSGDDTIRVGAPDASTPGRTDLLKINVLPDGGSNAGDTLIIDDSGDPTGRQATVVGNRVGGSLGDDLLGRFGAVAFTGFDSGSVTVRLGTGNDRLVLDDTGDQGSTAYTLSGSQIVRTGVGAPLNYSGLDRLLVKGGDGPNAYVVNATGATRSTDIFDGVGPGTFTIQGAGLQGTTSFNGGDGSDTFALNAGTGVAGTVSLSGGGGSDSVGVTGTPGTDAATFKFTGGAGNGVYLGLGQPVTIDTLETAGYSSGGGADSLTWADGTRTTIGTPSDVDGGIIYIPTGATSGRVVVNRGSAFPLFRFDGVSGQFAINGDADGTGAGDVLAVYGVSTTGLQSGIGETTAANGADTIAVSDQGVSIANASLGTLRSVSFAQTNGQPTFATVYVRTGNESGPTGDTVTATPTNQFNLIVDGMGPVGATPGNRISVAASGPTTRFRVSDPSLGPPHTVVQQISDGASVGFLNFSGGIGAGSGLVAAGTGAGVETLVQAYDPVTGVLKFQVDPFPGFTGGTSVAAGDVTGDGVPDLIVGAGPGGQPVVNVYDGISGGFLYSFLAFEPSFAGGVTVSSADFDKDGFADIILGTGIGGGPHVVVVSGRDQHQILSVFVYEDSFRGGVNVSEGDFNGDGVPDLVTSTQAGGGPRVVVLSGVDLSQLASFYVFDPADRAGFFVTTGDVTGDGVPDVIAGSGSGDPAIVSVFSGVNFGLVTTFFLNDPFDATATFANVPFDTGVRVATADATGDGIPEIVTAKGPGSPPTVRFFQFAGINPATNALQTNLTEVKRIEAFDPSYGGGVFVGGG